MTLISAIAFGRFKRPATTYVQASGTSGSAQDQHYVALDGWRGVCALSVALYHLMAAGHFFYSPFVRSAYLFVDFFFVLSGFVMAHAYSGRLRNGREARRFALKRIARIWPLHVTVLGVMIMIEMFERLLVHGPGGAALGSTFAGPYKISGILPNAFLVQSIGIFEPFSWNIPSWSISSEMATYVVFAALCLTVRSRLLIVAGVVSAVAGMLVAALSPSGMDVPGGLGLCRCMFGFFLGYLVYRAHRASPALQFRASAFAGVAEIAAVAAVIAFVAGAGRGPASFLAPVVFAWVVYLFSFEAGIVSRCLRLRPFVFLGLISYSVYMVHYPIFTVVRKATMWFQGRLGVPLTFEIPHWHGEAAPMTVMAFGNEWVMDAVGLAFLGTCVATGWLTYRYVETPGRRMFDRRRDVATPVIMVSPSGSGLSGGSSLSELASETRSPDR